MTRPSGGYSNPPSNAETAAARVSFRRMVGRGEGDRPDGLLALTLLSLLVSGVAALFAAGAYEGGLLCSVDKHVGGANIPTAASLVGTVALAGSVIAVLVRNRPYLMLGNLVLASAGLLAGVVLVALSADSRITRECFMSSAETSTWHFEYTAVIWGLAMLLLLSQGRRLLRSEIASKLSVKGRHVEPTA